MTTIVLLGPHGAGKTTLGKRLAAALGVPFHDEVGGRLRLEPSWRPEGTLASDPQACFDEAVFHEESERDLAWLASGGGLRVVETWHPGNLAYACRRSPAVAARYLPVVSALVPRARPLCVWICPPWDVLEARRSEPGSLDFFLEVGRACLDWTFGAPVLRPGPALLGDLDHLISSLTELDALQGATP
jgi:hypothetical protein